MSFKKIKSNARTRFTENLKYLNYIASLEPKIIMDPVPLEVNIMKGLFYVHLYASFEKTINELIENTLLYIGSNSVKNNHFILPFNSISLVDKLKSFKDCGYNNFFIKAHEIFSGISEANVSKINETIFANNLQNVWIKTIVEITRSFGIIGFSISPKIRTTVDEIVEKRNAVAHGRETANSVGERFRTDVLRLKTNIIIEFTNYLIRLFEDYYTEKEYLKKTAKKYYV